MKKKTRKRARTALKRAGVVLVQGVRAAPRVIYRGGAAAYHGARYVAGAGDLKTGILSIIFAGLSAFLATMDAVTRSEWFKKYWYALPAILIIVGIALRAWARKRGRYVIAEQGTVLIALGVTLGIIGWRTKKAQETQPSQLPAKQTSGPETGDPQDYYVRLPDGRVVPYSSSEAARERLPDAASRLAETMWQQRAAA